MKVGIYIANLSPKEGGSFTFQDTILKSLDVLKSNHEFYIFYTGNTDLKSTSKLQFVKIENKPRTPWQKIKRMSQLAYSTFFLEQPLDPEISPLNKALAEYQIELCWFIAPHHELPHVPFITTVWDLQHRLQPFFPEVSTEGWKWQSRENNYSRTLPRAAFVFTGTQAGKKELQQFYGIPEERIKLLLHPTPNFALDYDGRKISFKQKLPKDFIFYPAQFWSHKNHIALLHALKLLNTKYKQSLSLVLTGADSGNLSFVKQRVKELGLEDKVIFPGFVTIDELIYLYTHAKALTYITFFGPENLPPLEAMALGCPVVASKVSGSEEQLGDAVFSVEPTDEEDIAQAVVKVINDKALREDLIKKGKKRAKEWTTTDYIEKVNSIIDEFEPYRRTWR